MNGRAALVRLPGRALLHGVLVVLAAATLFPFLVMVNMALKDRAQLATRFWSLPDPIRWENLAFGWESASRYLNSILVSASVCALVIIAASLCAYAFVQLRYRGSDAIYTAVISLLMVPGILMLPPLFLTTRALGGLNTYWGMILPQVAGTLPFAIFLFRGFFAEIPGDLFASARVDGAAEWQVLRHVVLPLSAPIASTVAVLNITASWNNYVWPLIVVRDESLRTIPLGLVFLRTEMNFNNMPNPSLEMAAYLVASVPLLVCFFFALRTFVRGMTSGALKA